jgi:amino acid permease
LQPSHANDLLCGKCTFISAGLHSSVLHENNQGIFLKTTCTFFFCSSHNLDFSAVYTASDQIVAASRANQVHRALQARHLPMIAIGGSIETGPFMVFDSAMSQSVLLSFFLSFFCLPCPSGLFPHFRRGRDCHLLSTLWFVFPVVRVDGDPRLGFTSVWDFCVNSSFQCMTIGWWRLAAYAVISLANTFTVNSYGEMEDWMAIASIVSTLVITIVHNFVYIIDFFRKNHCLHPPLIVPHPSSSPIFTTFH